MEQRFVLHTSEIIQTIMISSYSSTTGLMKMMFLIARFISPTSSAAHIVQVFIISFSQGSPHSLRSTDLDIFMADYLYLGSVPLFMNTVYRKDVTKCCFCPPRRNYLSGLFNAFSS